jgi:CHASE2 domain-containing sensor protein
MELAAYDHLMRLRPAAAPDDRLLVVGITEADIQALQEWPISDGTITEALTVLLAAEPQAVGLDLFRDVPIGEGQADLIALLSQRDRLYGVCSMSSTNSPGVAPPQSLPPERLGFADLAVDSGGILRRMLITAAPPANSVATGEHWCNTVGNQVFSLGFQLALAYLVDENIDVGLTDAAEIQMGDRVMPPLTPHVGGYRGVDAAGYQIMLNYRGLEDTIPQVTLGEVLAGQVPAEQIRDRIVLVGAITPEANDDFYTPYSGGLDDGQKMPGVIVHAQITSQLLSAVLDDRPLIRSWSEPVEMGWVILWSVCGAVFAAYVRRPLLFGLGAIAVGGGLYGGCFWALQQGIWVPMVPAALGGALGAIGVVLVDRFKQSAYGQAVYRQVKSFLRLKIDIDESRVEQQVAEITESDYFNQLQQRARNLRQQRDDTLKDEARPAPSPDSTPLADPVESASSARPPADALDALLQEAADRRTNLPAHPPAAPDTNEEPS